MNLLQRVSYNPLVTRVARTLRLRRILRRWYFRCARPPDGILRIELGGINAQFKVRTPEELRILGRAQPGHRERRILEILARKQNNGGVVYDIGSNIGLYTIVLAKAAEAKGQVVAFEPEYRSHLRLQENLELNALKNVRTFQVALGNCNGEAKLYFSDRDLVLSNVLRPRESNATYQTVRIFEGDRIREAENLPLPHTVKIDVEGFEYAVIHGFFRTLRDPTCKTVLCEVHPTLLPPGVTEHQIFQLLRLLGFDHIDVHRWNGIAEYQVLAFKA